MARALFAADQGIRHLAAAKARGRRLGTPDPAGAVKRMRGVRETRDWIADGRLPCYLASYSMSSPSSS